MQYCHKARCESCLVSEPHFAVEFPSCWVQLVCKSCRASLTPHASLLESIARMQQWRGHFDESVFKHFVRTVGIYPVGAIVRLESQRIAVVFEQNVGAHEQPVVKVFYSNKSRMPIPLQRVDLAAPGCYDRIVAREPTEAWAKVNLDAVWAAAA